MYPPTYLEWFHRDEWHHIGWAALTPESLQDLRRHGAALAATKPGHYRLIRPSCFSGRPPTVLQEWTPRPA